MRINEELNVEVRYKENIYKFDNIILWGAGGAFPETVKSIGRDYISAVFDNDKNKWGEEICGFTIHSPVTELREFINQSTAIVISTNGYVSEIAKDLIKKGFQEKQLFSNTNAFVEEYRYLPEKIDANFDRILKNVELFYDEDSKKYYMNFIKACLSRNPIYFEDNKKAKGDYCYDTDLSVGLTGGELILDCGAFTGDTAKQYIKITNNNCKVYCFEAVKDNYNELRKWVEKEKKSNVIPVHVGVGEDTYNAKVYSTQNISMMAAVGNNSFQYDNPVVDDIKVDKLDNLVKNEKVDYIKMDIEGAELSALKGAEKIILRDVPQLMISGYHKIEDLWEIPEYVLGLNSNYKMLLGHQMNVAYEPEFLFVIK